MREIKFRAWDKDMKAILYPDGKDDRDLVYSFNDGNLWSIKDGDWQDRVDIIFMQYTGFKDSNGLEIYEGDIIEKFEDNHSRFSGVYQIEWKRAGFYIRRGDDLVTFGIKIARSCRVIGNIYEKRKDLVE